MRIGRATPSHALQGVGELLLRPASLVSDAFAQADVVGQVEHRPWPLPAEPWFMAQTWLKLLFAHWPVEPEAVRRVVPPQLPLDTYEGKAWLGVTPFLVRNLRLRGTPPAPWLSSFAEINVRTYVVVEGRPGIYFLSLDAASHPAVFAARRAYRLPYFRSAIETEAAGAGRAFAAKRISRDGPAAEIALRYGPDGPHLPQRDDSLERWLAERYCLYTLDQHRRVHRGEIHHPPWPLRPAWAELDLNSMATPFGLALDQQPLLHYSDRQDVVLWPIHRLGVDSPG